MRVCIEYYKSNFFVNSFVDAKRHFQVAFCSRQKIERLVASGVIQNSDIKNLAAWMTFKERVQHLGLALLESLGICLLALSFLIDYLDRRFHRVVVVKRAEPKTHELIIRICKYLETHAPSNAVEYLVSLMNLENAVPIAKYFRLCDQHLLQAFRHRENVRSSSGASHVLFSYYLGSLKGCPCLAPTGEYVGHQSALGKVVYAVETGKSCSPLEVHDSVYYLLRNELAKNAGQRPQKIFIPMGWEKEGIQHCTLLVVEPSSTNEREARVTMINTNGNSPTKYIDYEKEALRAAQEIYHAKETVVSRNEKSIYTTAFSCGHDNVEIACELAQVDNVQETVRRGLSKRTPEEDRKNRLKHGEDVVKFFARYR